MSFRIWERHWVTVYTSDADGQDGIDECAGHFRRVYEGCVRDWEWRLESVSPRWPATLSLYLPIVVGERRHIRDAEALQNSRIQNTLESWIVELGSEQDKSLESYGKKKLPT